MGGTSKNSKEATHLGFFLETIVLDLLMWARYGSEQKRGGKTTSRNKRVTGLTDHSVPSSTDRLERCSYDLRSECTTSNLALAETSPWGKFSLLTICMSGEAGIIFSDLDILLAAGPAGYYRIMTGKQGVWQSIGTNPGQIWEIQVWKKLFEYGLPASIMSL